MTLLNSILCQADAHYAREDWPAARDSLLVALGVAPDHPQLLGALGNLHFLLGEFPEAVVAYAAAARQGPDDVDLLVRLALCYRELRQFDELANVLGHVLRLTPEDSAAQLLLADCHRAAGHSAEAARLYLVLLARHPDHVGVLLALAKLLHDTGDWVGARVAWERVVAIEPENEIAQECLQAMGDLGPETSRRIGAKRPAPIFHAVAETVRLSRPGTGETPKRSAAPVRWTGISNLGASRLAVASPFTHRPPQRRRGPRRRPRT
jgi:tetratricopeptide (TPR) repeat protein